MLVTTFFRRAPNIKMRSRPEPQLAIVAGGDDVSKQETGEAHIVRTMTDGRSGLHGETASWGLSTATPMVAKAAWQKPSAATDDNLSNDRLSQIVAATSVRSKSSSRG